MGQHCLFLVNELVDWDIVDDESMSLYGKEVMIMDEKK